MSKTLIILNVALLVAFIVWAGAMVALLPYVIQ